MYHPQDRARRLFQLMRTTPSRFHGCQTEVANLDSSEVVREEDVVRLEVSMDDILCVQITTAEETPGCKITCYVRTCHVFVPGAISHCD